MMKMINRPPSVLPDISHSRGEIGSFDVRDRSISPLEGEMSGRTEGGRLKSNWDVTA